MKKFIVFACMCLLFQACSKPTKDPYCILPGLTEMVRAQTACTDVWGHGASNEETISKLSSYLSAKQIVISNTSMRSTGETVHCKACNCSTGFEFHVWVESQYINALKAEGFTVK